MRGDQVMLAEDRDGGVRRPQPQLSADESERYRVQTLLELDVTVAMHASLGPHARVRCHIRQRLHERPLHLEALERLLPSGTVDTKTGFLHHPLAGLHIEIGEITELAQRQEVAFDVLDTRL